MPSKKATPKRASNRRKGLVPGEYRKRSVVYIERLRRDEEKTYLTDDMMTTDPYIVITHRMDTDWDYTVELKGEMMRIPGRVLDRIISQRESIIKEQRSDRGTATAERLRATADADQEAAQEEEDEETQRLKDLGGK